MWCFLRIWLIRLLEQTQHFHISMKENKCYLTIFSWSQAEETHSFPHTEQLTEGIKFLLSEIWLITMQMKPHSLWIRHTVQLQPIITEADASVWLTSEQRERERTNWCGGRWDAMHIAEKWRDSSHLAEWVASHQKYSNHSWGWEEWEKETRDQEGERHLLPRGD